MIVDTSAVVALLLDEPQAPAIARLLAMGGAKMSAATAVELAAVALRRLTPKQARQLDSLLDAYGVELVPFTGDQARVAREALRDFGRGSGHPAQLNLGDAFAYALAASTGEPLLFVGDDFRHTDLVCALEPN